MAVVMYLLVDFILKMNAERQEIIRKRKIGHTHGMIVRMH